MEKINIKTNNNIYIQYNSIISINVFSEDNKNIEYAKYLITEDNLEHSLIFKTCKSPLIDYLNLKRSFFYIRNINECIENFGVSENENQKKREIIKKELGFLSKEKLQQNNQFFLQHMMSKMFVSIERTINNNTFILKLTKNIDNAAFFALRKINEKRYSKDFLTTKELYYLSIHIKEDDQYYFLSDDINPICKNDDRYFNILIEKNPISKFFFTTQNWNNKDSKRIYSGQLVNIIFSFTKGNKEEQFMLCVKKAQNLNDIENNKNEEKNDNNDSSIDYRIVAEPYTTELYEHVLNNSFWEIEENLQLFDCSNKQPIKTKKNIRIKNVDTGLYLWIRKKKFNDNSQSEDMSSYLLEDKTFEFILVDENKLNEQLFLKYNFLFSNYMLDSSDSEIIDEGKYILKGVFRKLKLSHLKDIEFYYQSISINMFEKSNNIIIKNEDDFIFKIKKIDIFIGNEVNYIKTIISNLEKEIKQNQLSNDNIINEYITFFLEYLLNIDYSFKDGNFEYNVPVKERQILLFSFNIIETIENLIDNYLQKLDNLLIVNKGMLKEILNNIFKFLKCLSVNNEEIKLSIYIIILNKLLKLAESIFNEDITVLINFIFDLIDNSEALQDYLLGGGGLLKRQISKKKELLKYNINDLLRDQKLFQYIEQNYNYLICYEKLIGLNKVQYKRKEIISHIKEHIEEVKTKNNPCIKTYRQIIDNYINEIIILIKKHAILLEKFRFIGTNNLNLINEKVKKRRTHFNRKKSIKESLIKKKNEQYLKNMKNRMNTIGNNNNIDLINSSKNLTKNLLDNEINNNNNNNINNDNNKYNLKNIFTFTSVNTNTNEVSDSARLLKESTISIEKLKTEFTKETLKNIEPRKTTKFLNINLNDSTPILKTKKIEKIKTSTTMPIEKEESIEENIGIYQSYLNKLGKIWCFIKFFSNFDFDKSLFIKDIFFYDIFKNSLKPEDFENTLYIFFIGKTDSLQNNNWRFNPNIIILYLLRLYNMLFPSLESKLAIKIKQKINLSGNDIIEELPNDNADDICLEIDENNYKQLMKEDFKIIDEYLCIIYSIYQFCINQYVKTVYLLSSITSNFFLNYCENENIKKYKLCFMETIKHLLSKFVFMKNDILEKIYKHSIINPSIINKEFDLENLFQNDLSDKKNIINNKRKINKKKYSNKETILIEYILYFLKKCEEIKYLYEKITIYKYIKNLIYDEKSREELNDNYVSNVEIQLLKMLQILFNKRIKILITFEKLINTNIKYSLDHHQKSKEEKKNNNENIEIEEGEKDRFVVFKVGKKTKIVIELLRQYEIEKFFNNIIYIESNENFMEKDKIIKKIRKMKEHFYRIQNEIQIIQINLGKDNSLIEIDNKSSDYEDSNQKYFISLNRHLSQICNESGKLFNMNNIVYKSKDMLSKIISMENITFYKKIKFCKTFKYLIEALNYYQGEKEQNILIYCSYLLKIFNDWKNIDYFFHKNIVKYYELFCSLVLRSLKMISKYPIEKIGENEQYLFLNICFFGIEDFLLIIKNCNLNFFETKDFMENVFAELRNIFIQFKNKKYKIVYQILYTYAISRILLFLNKKKTYDSYSYEVFFKTIYPMKKMRENISVCIEAINNNSNKENIISGKNTNIFHVKDNSYVDQDAESLSFNIDDDDKELLIDQDFKSKIMSMDLSNVNINIESKKSKQKTIINKDEEIENEKSLNEDFIRWDDENELNRLSFYLNFLSIYVIYLNDKNSLLEENNDDFSRKEKKEIEEKFSFNNLSSKIKELLDYKYFNNSLNNNENTNNLFSSKFEFSLIKEEKKYFGEELGPKNVDYKFHSVLLESILNYKATFGKNNVEIQVKKAKIKNDENNNDEHKNETQNEELSMLKNSRININNNSNNIIFYYYNPEYIDIILLEKIFNDIELKEDIMSYCIEEYHYERENPKLLDILLNNKKTYKLIESYYEEEYNLIHNHFIKNNMEILIKEILNSFHSNDLIEIESMGNYLFKKMGEIYTDTNIKMSDECLEKNISLVEYLLTNEENINPNLNKIDLLTFFDSLVYIYPKFKKSICILYYKIGFTILADKCKDELLKYDTKGINFESIKKIDLESITKILILLFSRNTNRVLIEDKEVFPTMLNSIRDFFSYIKIKGGGFIFKYVELLKELFHNIYFIFDHLSKDFEEIVNYMKKQSNIKETNEFIKERNKLENLLNFLIIFLEFKKIVEENTLTEEITKFTGQVVEKAIKLIFILLELPNKTNIEIIEILIDFLFNFIKGPDINNLNLLFSYGYFNLVTYVIKEIDYYQLFLNYLNKDNMHEIIDGISENECRIIKIFIIYHNVSHGNYKNSSIEFEKLQHWYEENFEYIRKKLKRLYYISEKEMKGKEYDVTKMLLFINSDSDDNYTECELKRRGDMLLTKYELDSLYEIKYNKKSKKEKKQNSENNEDIYCIIKFDLLLAYYSLYNYHNDLSSKTRNNTLNIIKKNNKNFIYWVIKFFIDLILCILNIISLIFLIIYTIFRKISSKIKNDVDLLQDLKNIDIKSQLIDDKRMINYLGTYIRELEVSIKNIIFKIYFPMIDKANTIEEYKEDYYKVEKIDSSDFINHILSNYDSINIRAKQYVNINKIIKIPIIKYIFKNMYIYPVLLIILGILSNLLIMTSFSTFINIPCGKDDKGYYPNVENNSTSVQCPHFLYKEREKDETVSYLKGFGITELILQCLIFMDYIVRIFSVEKGLIKLKSDIKKLKKGITKYYKIKMKLLLIYKCIINFRSLYYILSIAFIILGLQIHPFFNCITLLEFVNRIQLMQTVLKAMYKPLKNILITLLMFIILEYFFSLFAVSIFVTHFPNDTDTETFLKTFMRMIDQTFKQDGGIGTYLDKSLDKGFIPYSASSFINLRFFFDLLFFLLILLLIFQMFLSTIIDYFNETRENSENFKEGLETQCTVCCMEREKIEKIYSNDKNAFDNHINYYHNAFNYIYYLMYLQLCSSRDGIIENTIWNLYLKKDLSYLPKNICFKQFEKKSWKKLNKRKNKEEEQ